MLCSLLLSYTHLCNKFSLQVFPDSKTKSTLCMCSGQEIFFPVILNLGLVESEDAEQESTEDWAATFPSGIQR